MTFDRRRALLVTSGVLTLLIWTYKLWPAGKPVARPAQAVAPATPAASAAAAVEPAPPLSRDELKTWAALHTDVPRDPFFTAAEIAARNRPRTAESRPEPPAAPVLAPRPPLPRYVLSLVMTVGSERMATLGDRVVKVGDMLGAERVAQILPDAVVLEHGGERRRVELSAGNSLSGPIKVERVR